MIGILIVTHGNLGKELLATAELIMGKAENAEAIALNYQDDIRVLKDQVAASIERLDTGDGVVVFTDLFGGSPNNSVASNLKDMDFKAITGTNLPMVIECITARESMDADELIKHVEEVGKDSIKVLNEIFEGKES